MNKYFTSKELLPKYVFDKYGDLGLRYMDNRILNCLYYIREAIGKPIIVNSDEFPWRTLRDESCPDFSTFSDHSFGRAIDFDVVGMDSLEVQKLITKDINISTALKGLGLTGIEDGTVGWSHITCANFEGWDFSQINGIYLIPNG